MQRVQKKQLATINKLIKKFSNTYNNDIIKFILLLRKRVHSYQHMDSWKRKETTLPNKNAFYSNLYLEKLIYMLKKYSMNLN